MLVTANYLGAMCKEYRNCVLKIPQSDIASDLGISQSDVSKFETGKNDRATIFFWYIRHGIFDWVEYPKWVGWCF